MTVEGTTIQVVEKPQEKIGIDMTSGHIHTYISVTTVLELVGAKLLKRSYLSIFSCLDSVHLVLVHFLVHLNFNLVRSVLAQCKMDSK